MFLVPKIKKNQNKEIAIKYDHNFLVTTVSKAIFQNNSNYKC